MNFSKIFPIYIFFPKFVKDRLFKRIRGHLQTKLQILRDNHKQIFILNFFIIITFFLDCGGTVSRHKNYLDYAPGDPKIPLGSENPNEYLSLALYLTFPVSKSPSIAVLIGALTNIFSPLGTSVLMKNASVSVK